MLLSIEEPIAALKELSPVEVSEFVTSEEELTSPQQLLLLL